MPKYKVLEKSLIGNEIHEAGAIVDYDGLPAENLEPQCDEGKAKYQEYLDTNAERVKTMRDQHSDSAVGDPATFAKAIADAVAAGIATAMIALQPAPEATPAPATKGKGKDSLV